MNLISLMNVKLLNLTHPISWLGERWAPVKCIQPHNTVTSPCATVFFITPHHFWCLNRLRLVFPFLMMCLLDHVKDSWMKESLEAAGLCCPLTVIVGIIYDRFPVKQSKISLNNKVGINGMLHYFDYRDLVKNSRNQNV